MRTSVRSERAGQSRLRLCPTPATTQTNRAGKSAILIIASNAPPRAKRPNDLFALTIGHVQQGEEYGLETSARRR